MKKLCKVAKELLQSANKIYHYRRDVIPEGRLVELEKAVSEVQSLLEAKDEVRLEAALGRLDGILKKVGGKMYPKTFWNDNLEVALVAAIIVIGIRTFFFQPFIIPTNSMYPTYSGMNAVIYDEEAGEPGALNKFFRLATLGARHKAITAKNSGDVQIAMARAQNGSMQFYFESVKGKKYFVLPAVRKQYTILVGGVPHTIIVPSEFDMNSTLAKAFDLSNSSIVQTTSGTGFALDLEKQVEAGEDVLRFDITLGDALFVDRISYHFKKPEVGDPFVFRTDQILKAVGDATGDYTPKYYIKRLVGVEGETLEIVNDTLLVDGQPRDEVEAFDRNARREGEYSGYVNQKLLAEGRSLKIPEDSFVALGDNSANSADSRYWGFVPEKAVIGKAFFIYYPFTKRWGLAE